ncbi:S9 family peptidase [Peribacillus glennii]|uniref:S9 family peptidase n=1 Tax=Peribacillus glennii TaxID=2303991 RepID=A0A372LHM3_9BACI|nr:S9 family peptidase [Peribacillus glennii]RFU65106.1 S9 family peptidase [Peribacillus glennii]
MRPIAMNSNLHAGTVKEIVHHGKDQLIYTADFTGLTQLWQAKPGTRGSEQTSFTEDRITFATYIKHKSIFIIGMDFAGNERHQLYVLTLDGTLLPLTNAPEHTHIYGGSSPDGNWIAWSSDRRHPEFLDIYIQNLNTFDIYPAFIGYGSYTSLKWSPDGYSLLIKRTNTSTDNDLGLLQIGTGQVSWLTQHSGEASFKDPHFSSDGNHLFLLTNKDREFFGLASLNFLNKNLTWLLQEQWDLEELTINKGKNKLAFSINERGISRGMVADLEQNALFTWKTPMGVIANLVFSEDDQNIAFIFSGPAHPPDIWHVDLHTMQAQEKHTTTVGELAGHLIEPFFISYRSFDNLDIPALYYQPKNTAYKLPVVIYLHGGPETQSRPEFNPLLQHLLSQGYAICTPNVRGSTGYGKTYSHLDDARRRMDSVKDLVWLVQWLITAENVDPKKIALIGGSYGGFMVLSAITHYPDFWSAAIDISGISSIKAFLQHTSPWRRKQREAEYGTVERDAEFFDRIDPIHYTERITAPLMVIHGATDPRVPIEESEQLVNRLRSRGHPVRYIRFEDEGHSLAKRVNRRVAYSAIVDFLNRNNGL